MGKHVTDVNFFPFDFSLSYILLRGISPLYTLSFFEFLICSRFSSSVSNLLKYFIFPLYFFRISFCLFSIPHDPSSLDIHFWICIWISPWIFLQNLKNSLYSYILEFGVYPLGNIYGKYSCDTRPSILRVCNGNAYCSNCSPCSHCMYHTL